MYFRAATLTCAVLLVGCQNASNQLSLYAPFGPQSVPAPSLTRANSTPYYTPGDLKSAPPAGNPATASQPDKKELSHYDPYRGVLVPGNFTPAPVLARSSDAWSSNNLAASSPPRERASTEEPIRIVENSSAAPSSIAASPSSSRSGAVKFNATPLSGAVRSSASLAATPQPTTFNAVEVARLPKPPVIQSTPVNLPTSKPPGLLPTPSLTPPPKPGTPGRVSLWNDPGDGSRVMPASHVEIATPVAAGDGTWKAKN
ncbi:hypothetical protein [Anatilimnocola floriformis]|uniref:hypothetical protein n=1 Tax=Anatilimnocola floriformis TaxID=2948575 RepID=UPI0020C32A5B|nr:hypothetical protein [Anatilimnocola floriformis]